MGTPNKRYHASEHSHTQFHSKPMRQRTPAEIEATTRRIANDRAASDQTRAYCPECGRPLQLNKYGKFCPETVVCRWVARTTDAHYRFLMNERARAAESMRTRIVMPRLSMR